MARVEQGIDFAPAEEHQRLREAVASFVAEQVIPREDALRLAGGAPWSLIQELRAEARAAKIYGPQLPTDLGGLGLDWRGAAVLFEEAGVSLLGPLALNCAAPDEGNMHLLHEVANPEQQERYLRPLAAGTIRSCFAMTEPPPGAGADPTQLQSRARRDGDGWVIDGHKWYITGAQGAAVAIIMARTSQEVTARHGATMFLVPTDTPGWTVVRTIPSIDETSFYTGHCEVRLERIRVGDDAVLGEVGKGFDYAQIRLAPARLTHCMRWLGVARRSLEIATAWAQVRTSGGTTLGEHQMVQAMLADSAIDIHAARLMIHHAAWTLDSGKPGRAESSMAKVFVSEAVGRVVDRAMQICGSQGMSDELPLALFYREVRPFRIYDGPSEVHRAAIARRLLRQGAGGSKQSGDYRDPTLPS